MAQINKLSEADSIPRGAATINQIIDELARMNRVTTSGGINYSNSTNGIKFWLDQNRDYTFAQIVHGGNCAAPDGSADTSEVLTTTNRYYVETGFIDMDESDACNAALSLTKYDSSDPRWKGVLATNIAEMNYGSHRLPEGTWVLLYKQKDDGSPSTERWFFNCSDFSMGQYIYMVGQMVAQNQFGFDYLLGGPAMT